MSHTLEISFSTRFPASVGPLTTFDAKLELDDGLEVIAITLGDAPLPLDAVPDLVQIAIALASSYIHFGAAGRALCGRDDVAVCLDLEHVGCTTCVEAWRQKQIDDKEARDEMRYLARTGGDP